MLFQIVRQSLYIQELRALLAATVVNTLNLVIKPSQLDWSSITYLS